MKIAFVDLVRQYSTLQKEMDEAVLKVMQKGSFILGENVREFEREFASYIGAKYGLGVGSGTDALHIALEALGIGPKDEVITVSHTFVATAYSIIHAGTTPVFVDIDPETYTINPELIEKAITPKTKAILPVHLYGQPANMTNIMEIAKKHNLRVVEDVAQAHGAKFQGQTVGTFGDIGCFSFYPGKNLGAYGDGGLIVTNDEAVAEKVRMLREYGQKAKYHHEIVGYNSRLDEMQAAILRIKLRHLEAWNENRRRNAKLYDEQLSDLPMSITTPKVAKDRTHVYHLYVIRAKQRQLLQDFLSQVQISTGIHYPIPVHKQPACVNIVKQGSKLTITEQIVGEILSLPMFPELKQEEIQFVCDNIKKFYK